MLVEPVCITNLFGLQASVLIDVYPQLRTSILIARSRLYAAFSWRAVLLCPFLRLQITHAGFPDDSAIRMRDANHVLGVRPVLELAYHAPPSTRTGAPRFHGAREKVWE